MISHVRFASTVVLTLTVFSVAATAQLQDPQPIPLGQTAKDVQLSRRLSPAGRRVRQLHFSLDGRLLLAQDDSGITVLMVQPFSVLFRIPSANIAFSGFTPDSRQVLFLAFRGWVPGAEVVFAGPTAHLERWSVADRARVESAELPWRACESWGLSPDGRLLVCVDSTGTLSLTDAASSATLFEKKDFGSLVDTYDQWGNVKQHIGDPGDARIDFSPDGRLVIAMPDDRYGSVLVWDLLHGGRVSTTWSFSRRLAGGARFAVLAPDRILTSTYSDFRPFVTTKLVTFPSGKLVSKPKLPRGPIYRAADPNFVIVRPFAGVTREDLYNPKRSAAVEIRTGQVIVCDSPALDVFGRYYAAERTDGELGLYERGKGLQATVTIPSQ